MTRRLYRPCPKRPDPVTGECAFLECPAHDQNTPYEQAVVICREMQRVAAKAGGA